MGKEIGPREKALREKREADFDDNQKRMRDTKVFGFQPSRDTLKALGAKIEIASQKRGKPRKAKK